VKPSIPGQGTGGLFGLKERPREDAVVQHRKEEKELLKRKGNACVSNLRPKWFMATLWLDIKKQRCSVSDHSSLNLSKPGLSSGYISAAACDTLVTHTT